MQYSLTYPWNSSLWLLCLEVDRYLSTKYLVSLPQNSLNRIRQKNQYLFVFMCPSLKQGLCTWSCIMKQLILTEYLLWDMLWRSEFFRLLQQYCDRHSVYAKITWDPETKLKKIKLFIFISFINVTSYSAGKVNFVHVIAKVNSLFIHYATI